MGGRKIVYRGISMAEGWPGRIEEAQTITTYTIRGTIYKRIPYGKEQFDWHAGRIPCHDCRVILGELHVPECDVEECPRCHGQALSCRCEYEGHSFKVRLPGMR